MNAIEMIIEPRSRDLGGFQVGRVLPYAKKRMVGPFIFLDVMGPDDFPAGKGIDVRPHPHIGLATVTYLFDGAFRHRDSLGCDQLIRPGDVNWMTAGRGIVHSERTDTEERASGQRVFGLQSWIALPNEAEDVEPSFTHHPKDSLPVIEKDEVKIRLIAGEAFGARAPVETFSPMFYCDVEAQTNAALTLPDQYQERAVFLIKGEISVDGVTIEAGRLIVIAEGATPLIQAKTPAKLMLLGGDPVGARHIWWNLVSSDPMRIERAKADWNASAAAGFQDSPFSLPPDEDEFIPLPEA